MFEQDAYVSFATFRKDGRKVATPIWAAPLDDYLVMFSAPDAGKVKRLRNSSKAALAVCDVRGKLLGDWVDAEAWLIDDPDTLMKAQHAMREKYGWQSTLLDFVSRLTGRLDKRQYIGMKPMDAAFGRCLQVTHLDLQTGRRKLKVCMRDYRHRHGRIEHASDKATLHDKTGMAVRLG